MPDGVTSPPSPTPPHPTPSLPPSCLLRLMNVCLKLCANDSGCRLLLYRFSANMGILNSLLWSCLSTWHCCFECNPTRMKDQPPAPPPPLPPGPFLKPVWTTYVVLCTYELKDGLVSYWFPLRDATSEASRKTECWVDLCMFPHAFHASREKKKPNCKMRSGKLCYDTPMRFSRWDTL